MGGSSAHGAIYHSSSVGWRAVPCTRRSMADVCARSTAYAVGVLVFKAIKECRALGCMWMASEDLVKPAAAFKARSTNDITTHAVSAMDWLFLLRTKRPPSERPRTIAQISTISGHKKALCMNFQARGDAPSVVVH